MQRTYFKFDVRFGSSSNRFPEPNFDITSSTAPDSSRCNVPVEDPALAFKVLRYISRSYGYISPDLRCTFHSIDSSAFFTSSCILLLQDSTPVCYTYPASQDFGWEEPPYKFCDEPSYSLAFPTRCFPSATAHAGLCPRVDPPVASSLASSPPSAVTGDGQNLPNAPVQFDYFFFGNMELDYHLNSTIASNLNPSESSIKVPPRLHTDDELRRNLRRPFY
ncbi:hypothetical protein C8R44DRAFT_726455 [Mycena epipterygia]|nr:hypothetical protein C8R44DRAFT_726455 [Mycena epipterygia]